MDEIVWDERRKAPRSAIEWDAPTEKIDPVQAALIAGGRWVDRRAAGVRAAVPAPIRNAVDSLNTKLGMGAVPSIDPARIADDTTRFAELEKSNPVATFIGDTLPSAAVMNPAGMALLAGAEIGTPEERAARSGLAYAGGRVGQWAGGKIAGVFEKNAAAGAAQRATAKAQNAVRDATTAEAQAAGFVFPPAQVAPGVVNNSLEGLAGKINTAQNASIKNQNKTMSIVRKDLGLPADAPIAVDTLQAIRSAAHAKGYEPIKQFGKFDADEGFAKSIINQATKYDAETGNIASLKNPAIEGLLRDVNQTSFSSESVIPLLRNLREQGFANKAFGQNAQNVALGKAQISVANEIENLVERNLAKSGQGELLQNFRDARKLMAKTFTVEKALNPATGNVDANKLGAMFKKGKPLSDGLLTIGKTASAFPAAMKEVTTSMPGISPLDYMGGILSSGATGNPLLMATTFARPIARAGILSDPFQKSMVKAPSYDADAIEKLMAKLGKDKELTKRLGGLLGLSGQLSFQ